MLNRICKYYSLEYAGAFSSFLFVRILFVPMTTEFAGMSWVTIALAPIMQSSPIVTGPIIVHPVPRITLLPILA